MILMERQLLKSDIPFGTSSMTHPTHPDIGVIGT